jgi:hypothetical protein
MAIVGADQGVKSQHASEAVEQPALHDGIAVGSARQDRGDQFHRIEAPLVSALHFAEELPLVDLEAPPHELRAMDQLERRDRGTAVT